jgi:hypothetical protein
MNVLQIMIRTILTGVGYRFGKLLTRLPAAQLCPGFESRRLFLSMSNSDEDNRKALHYPKHTGASIKICLNVS